MLELAGQFDYLICGDDAVTARVIAAASPRLKIISKYGIGVDKIDVTAATSAGLPVLYTPGVNHTTVAEHAFALLLALHRNLVEEANHTAAGRWTRITGRELFGKTLGVVGLGRIGREVAIRARAFGLQVVALDEYWDEAFAQKHGVERVGDAGTLFSRADMVSLHAKLDDSTRGMVCQRTLAQMRPGGYLINTARGEIVVTADLLAALDSGHLAGYATDVLDEEPPSPDNPLLRHPKVLITPHIGSRTHESVQRQATMAVENLILAAAGKKPLAQLNA